MGVAQFVHSERGKGTTFKVYLPRQKGSDVIEPERPAAPQTMSATARILLVEDDDAVQRAALRALQSSGHTVYAASNGSEGFAKVEQLVLIHFATRYAGKYQTLIDEAAAVFPKVSAEIS